MCVWVCGCGGVGVNHQNGEADCWPSLIEWYGHHVLRETMSRCLILLFTNTERKSCDGHVIVM